MDPANPSMAPPQPAAASHHVHSADPLLSFHRESPPCPEVHADNDAVQEGLQPLDVEILSHLGADGRIHSLHRSGPDEWYECPICHKVYESAQVFSAHTGTHYRALNTAANAIRLHRKHDKELQNNKLQLQEFDNGSVVVVHVSPTSTVAKKKINLLDDGVDALGGESDHRNGTDLVVGRQDHHASTSNHEWVRAKKRRARALGVGGIAAPQSGRGHDDNVNFHRIPPPRPEVHADNDAVQEGLQPLDVEILSHLGADGRIHSLHRSRPDEWYECPICHEVYESAQVFSAHTGVHYRALSTAANVIRLHRKHDKELQNNKLRLLKFDDGSVAVVPVNPTSTEVKKKINLLDGRDDALGGESDHRNGTDLVVGRHDHHASTSGQCHESMRAKKKRARALGVGGIGAPQS
ncbi:hypothetical protein DVH24_042040 [Malus domestica]|uniref:C2H2-type domain-containing protein n=1 Tax=Malus domestica TaxID=3750 RepID=A0A498ITM8_MALDO|nr:hypothetical protein DVH24_042040 [Malus domestica]